MSRTSVRRLTAGIVLLAVLCLALPGAAAAAPVRPHAAKAPAVSLLEQKPQTKTIGLPVGPIDLNGAKSSNADSNTAIDPNG
jgi:hypothetical protein